MTEKLRDDLFIKYKDLKLISTDDDNREITVKDMYESIKPGQFLFLMFFNRWG